MSVKIKNFIKDNRNEFDDKLPSDKVWENIETSFSQTKKKKFILKSVYKWSMAAAAMLFIAFGIYFIANKKSTEITAVAIAEPDVEKLALEYAPQMNQFIKMIDTKQEELKLLSKDQPELYQQFTSAINQLDSSYNTLKNQLIVTPNRETLVEAMIQNLQLQLNILNQQLKIINRIKKNKNYYNEKKNQSI